MSGRFAYGAILAIVGGWLLQPLLHIKTPLEIITAGMGVLAILFGGICMGRPSKKSQKAG